MVDMQLTRYFRLEAEGGVKILKIPSGTQLFTTKHKAATAHSWRNLKAFDALKLPIATANQTQFNG